MIPDLPDKRATASEDPGAGVVRFSSTPLGPRLCGGTALAAVALTALLAGCAGGTPPYRDPSRPIDRRVADLLGRMTLEEKFWQLLAIPDDPTIQLDRLRHGAYGLQVRPPAGSGAREVAARVNALQRHFTTQTRLGIPIIPFEEALHGVTQAGATVFPQAIGLAATWDTALVRRVAAAIAAESRARGIRQVLSPVVNIASDVRWGRTEETYGEDPYLSSRMAVAFVAPFERAGVVTTPKHFVANVGDGGRDSYPIEISDRWLAELHLPPFAAAIREAGARSIMAAYNSVDGSPASANRRLLTDKLRKEIGFRGVIISDAGGVGGANVLHMTSPDYPTSAARALEAGLDVIFQTSADHAALFWPAFERGTIPSAVIDSAVARVLQFKFELGLFEQPFVSEDSADVVPQEHRDLALEAARASIVLLHNEKGALPLESTVGRVALIGVDADSVRLGGYSGPGERAVSMRRALESRLPGRVTWEPGPGRGEPELVPIPASALGGGLSAELFGNPDLAGAPVVTRTDRSVDFNWPFGPPDSSLAFGWYAVRWRGEFVAPVTGVIELGVESNDGARLRVDGRVVVDTWARPSHAASSVTLDVVRGRGYPIELEYHERGGAGRIQLVWRTAPSPDWRAAIARAVRAAQGASVAVIVAGIEEGEFRDRAFLRLPGHQEELIRAVAATGTPVVVVIVGGSAVTMAPWLGRVGAVVQAWYPGEAGGEAVADVLLGSHNPSGRLPITFPRAEGQLPLNYYHKPTGRGDDYLDLTGRSLFPFGHGTGYSRFSYHDLVIEPAQAMAGDTVRVQVRLRNEGPRAGAEVVQLYLRDEVASVARPVLQLAAFERVHLEAGEERVVTLVVTPDRFSMVDEALHPVVEPGRFVVMVGASSVDVRVRGVVDLRMER